MLEPYVLKGTRTVLRREGGSNPIPDLSDHFEKKNLNSKEEECIEDYTKHKTENISMQM